MATFLINTSEEGGMGGDTVVGVQALVAWFKDQRHNPGEPEEIGVWATSAKVGDVCNWACGNVIRVTGDTYMTSQVRGVPPTQMIAWVQEWAENCTWGRPEPNRFIIYPTQNGPNKHLEAMRAKMGPHVPDSYDVPVGKTYRTLLMDDGLIQKVMTNPHGARVKGKPTEFKG